ncbi:MAG: GNAT family N-acetyltransferase [Betaproteobacteria bacterium]
MEGGVMARGSSEVHTVREGVKPPREPFAFGAHVAVEATEADVPAIATFYAQSPEYLRIVEARKPSPGDAAEFVRDVPPAGFAYTDAYNLLLRDVGGRVSGLMGVATDLPAAGVWHLGLLIVATRLHGSGFAQAAHAAYEQWARESGAQWLRLGVVTQNERGIRFWRRQGYTEVRRRAGIPMGTLTNTVILMAKPLAGGSWDEYLQLVLRDRPEAE